MTSKEKHPPSSNLSCLVDETLAGLSPIQTIMKMAEKRNILQLGLDPESVISFGGGWCNHFAPPQLQNVYKQIVSDRNLFHQSGRYSSIVGSYRCRQQLCRFEKDIYYVSELHPENIVLGHSSTQLFHDVLRVLLDPGEPIGVLDPTYANYFNAVKCALPNSSVWFIPALDGKRWEYLPEPDKSLEKLKQFCSKGLRAVVLPVPDNPTSQIPPNDFIKEIREILEDVGGFLILDFAYKALWFNDIPDCFSWSPADYANVVSIHSNSKWLSSLGRRFGWVEADTSISKGLEKINESVLLSPDTLHSMTTAMFLEQTLENGFLQQYIDETRMMYKNTADVLLQGLHELLDWKCLTPDGGLYTCCPTPNRCDPEIFVQRMLKHTGVLFIPGIGFGPSMRYGIRLSYGPLCYNHELILEGLQRVKTYLESKE